MTFIEDRKIGTPDGGFWHAKNCAVSATKFGIQVAYESKDKGRSKGKRVATHLWKYGDSSSQVTY